MRSPCRKKRKLHTIKPPPTAPNVPEEMTIPEIQAYLMEYNVPCPKRVSKAEFVKIFKEKVEPKLSQPKVKRPKTRSLREPLMFLQPFSPSKRKKNKIISKPEAMEVDNEPESGKKIRRPSRSLFKFPKSNKNPSAIQSLGQKSSMTTSSSDFSQIPFREEKKETTGDLLGNFGSRTFPKPRSSLSFDQQPQQGLEDKCRGPMFKCSSKKKRPAPEPRDNSSKKREYGPSVVHGNKIQFGPNIFGLGDNVFYKGTIGWRIVGIDFDSLTLNIQKGNRVRNTLPQFLEISSEIKDEKKSSPESGVWATSNSSPVHERITENVQIKPTNRGRNFAFALCLVCLALFGSLWYFIKQPSLNFCDSQNHTSAETNCIPCPKHANCRNGIAVCLDSWELHYDICREIKQLGKNISTIVQTVHLVLQEKRGEAECRLGPHEGESRVILEAYLSKIDMKSLVVEKLGLNPKATNGIEFVEHQRFLEAFELASIEFKHYFERSNLRNFWYSREARKPWLCLAKELLRLQSRFVAGIIFLTLCGLCAYWHFLSYRKYQNETIPIANMVKNWAMEILHNAAYSVDSAVAVEQLRKTILSSDVPGLAGVKPDSAAWKLGYSNLRLDERVVELMKVLDGENTPCLKLRNDTSYSPNLGLRGV